MTIRRRSLTAITAGLLTMTLFLAGCPIGDCWGTAAVTVSVDHNLAPPPGVPVLLARVTRIRGSDVTATSPDGLPIGPKAAEPVIFAVMFDPTTGIGHAYDEMTDPDPTWYYAFVDLNMNGQLDSGEAFGADPGNPSKAGGGFSCSSEHYKAAITIDRRLP